MTDGGGTVLRALSYTAGGDLSQDQVTGGDQVTYGYNALKRPASIQRNGAEQAEYAYNAFGQRVWRHVVTVFGITTAQVAYAYDLDGHLVAEHAADTGAVLREYVWLGDQLLAEIDSTNGAAATDYVHAGQIGEPLVMTNSVQATGTLSSR